MDGFREWRGRVRRRLPWVPAQRCAFGLLWVWAVPSGAMGQSSSIVTPLQAAPPSRVAPSSPEDPDTPPEQIVKVLRTSNVAQTYRYVPEVFTLHKVNPYEVIRFAKRVLEPVEGALFCFAHPNGTSGKMMVVAPEPILETLRPMMASLDREGLSSSAGGGGISRLLRHRDVTDPNLLDILEQEGTPEVRLLIDPVNNQLIVRDDRSAMARIAQTLELFDLPTPQVEVQVSLYEVDVTEEQRLGLDYVAWKNGPGRNALAGGAFVEKGRVSSSTSPKNLGSSVMGLPGRTLESAGRNAAWLLDVPAAYFDALVVSGRASTLSRISVGVMSGAEAVLEVGDSIQFHRFVSGAVGSNTRTRSPAITSRVVDQAFVGSAVRVTPDVLDGGVRLHLFASKVVLKGFADDGVPVLGGRAIDTELLSPYGKEWVIGGMVGSRGIDATAKMPWFGNIPVLGGLFGGAEAIKIRTLTVITVRVSDA